MIEARDISKSFGEKTVMHNVSCVFESGKTNLIIGKSGSGKTVLLKSLVGLYDTDRGSILYDGRNVTRMGTRARQQLRQEIGMIFQGSALFDYMTVLENVRFPLDMFTKLSVGERTRRAQQCLRRVNLDAAADNLYPAEISGGMQKRCAIARAIVLNPRYLFCDEPNSGLDPTTAGVIDSLISEITHERGITTIINTHDMNSVFTIGEHIAFISEGRKLWDGNMETILKSECPELQSFMKSAVRLMSLGK
ncbi:MAG: ATP-binding cassette domain-containing protein [Bacteroidales bacterium]|nr:ATP-binding cassette domain-containing protein [Bacteroidales bacterium]MDD7725895.1 ATP-binding cassette domain-containing protein [Bacteroidales bacterium]MDY4174884.1 ATP-binding cassette domain-containing protein [Bacteroidales bacterium]